MEMALGAIWGKVSAKGLFNMQTREVGYQTTNLGISRRPALPPEPQLSQRKTADFKHVKYMFNRDTTDFNAIHSKNIRFVFYYNPHK